MNIGQIPGYYYDEEKKKYFKIQANHVAPSGAKYSKANVNREKREHKRRKVNERYAEKRNAQTVQPSRLLQHPLAKAGLGRELGIKEPAVDLTDRDALFVSQLRSESVHVSPPNVFAASGSIFFATNVQHPSYPPTTVLAYNHGPRASIYNKQPDCLVNRSWPSDRPAIAFDSNLVSAHVCSQAELDPFVVAVTSQVSSGFGNVFIGDATENTPHARAMGHRREFFIRLQSSAGEDDTALWSSAAQCHDDNLAVSGTDAVYLIDLGVGSVNTRVSLRRESRSCAWLESRVVAFGEGNRIRLWDTRSGAGAMRFQLPLPVTGVKAPDTDGLHLLASDNKHLCYYDTRWAKKPLFSFNHLHQGPQLQFDHLSMSGIVAAVDVNDSIKVYELRTGKDMGALPWRKSPVEPLFSQVRWVEEDGAPLLQACHGGTIKKWRFGGPLSDD